MADRPRELFKLTSERLLLSGADVWAATVERPTMALPAFRLTAAMWGFHPKRCSASGTRHQILTIRRQHRQLEIGVAGKDERRLLVADKAVLRMVECPLAAFAPEHPMLVPETLEVLALPSQVRDEHAHGRVVQICADIGPELRHHTPGAGIVV